MDLDSQIDTGVDTLHVWAYPVEDGRKGDPIFVGAAEYGGARPDVAAIYGERFLHSGYWLPLQGLPSGTYRGVRVLHCEGYVRTGEGRARDREIGSRYREADRRTA